MNNEAQFGMRFAVKGAKQVQKTQDAINAKLKKMGVTAEQTSRKIQNIGKTSEEAGNKQKRALEDGTTKANQLSKSLDKVVRKWLSIGGAITLVSRIIRKAFAKMDEVTGLRRMSQVAGVLPSKIESIGKKLKELYGADSSSAASAYTSIGDILGAARSGRGISQDVVAASARYGIALNGGMLTEDQLLTNIARAMQAQRKRGNMYGVREIAEAFGIDDAMMLHLSERGANWDRGLPAANLSKMQKEAQQAKELQTKLDDMATKFINVMLPAILAGMNAIVKIAEFIENRWGQASNAKVVKGTNGNDLIVQKTKDGRYSVGSYPWNEKKLIASSPEDAVAQYNSYRGMLLTDPAAIASKLTTARSYADLYNKNLEAYGGANNALNRVSSILSGVGGAYATLKEGANGKLQIIIEDKAGVLRNMDVTTKTDNWRIPMVVNSTTGV